MSPSFEKWKRLYERNFATKEQLKQLVVIGVPRGITAEEYELITGEVYVA